MQPLQDFKEPALLICADRLVAVVAPLFSLFASSVAPLRLNLLEFFEKDVGQLIVFVIHCPPFWSHSAPLLPTPRAEGAGSRRAQTSPEAIYDCARKQDSAPRRPFPKDAFTGLAAIGE